MKTDSQNTPDAALVQAIEGIVAAACTADAPGLAIIVVKDGRVIFRQGYGMAHLELGIPIAPEMVFRLAPPPKHLTAVPILMFAELGTLALDDAITTFLPDYPTPGHPITVEPLLTHPSGIKGSTAMP